MALARLRVDLLPQHVDRVAVVVELALGPVTAHVAEVVALDPLHARLEDHRAVAGAHVVGGTLGRRVNGDGVAAVHRLPRDAVGGGALGDRRRR